MGLVWKPHQCGVVACCELLSRVTRATQEGVDWGLQGCWGIEAVLLPACL